MQAAASRIDEWRRRVDENPASLAFGPLAEEYRRAGRLEEAIATCRDGLARHPEYVAARVTLGRALLDLGETAAAQAEFAQVIREAPENLAAIRGLAEIHRRPTEGTDSARPVPLPPPPPIPLSVSGATPAAASDGLAAVPAAADPRAADLEAASRLQRFLDDIAAAKKDLEG